MNRLTDQQLTDLAARVALLEATVASIARAMGAADAAATIEPELEAQLRALGASDGAFRLRDLLLKRAPPAA